MTVGGHLMLSPNRKHWLMRAEPHVSMMAKRWFPGIPTSADQILTLSATPETSRQLEAFCDLYDVSCEQPDELKLRSEQHREFKRVLADLAKPEYQPGKYCLKLPPRDYQRIAADWILRVKGGLLGDALGLGKTASSICVMSAGHTLPAVVVCPTHLQRQWQGEIYRFAPQLISHIIKKRTLYDLPRRGGRTPDVLIISYHKLDAWAQVMAEYCRLVVFDEAQELRRAEDKPGSLTKKYAAAKQVANAMEFRLLLTGTPIWNYGGEIFNILEIAVPGRLGTWDEFAQAWCIRDGQDRSKTSLREPEAFGNWMRREHIMLRRTRQEVGRELDPLTRITHTIEADAAAINEIENRAGELARIILGQGEGHRGEKMQASEEFSSILRQATGIAKAPHVAAFCEMLIEEGESVVLFGWHRAVYTLWAHHLKKYSPAFYTGQESVSQKEASRERFLRKETPIMILSLRSGAGIDGLQNVSSTCVFGELDWAPGAHEQDIGRLLRDGQTKPVTAHFLVSDSGLDPVMCDVLGLKSNQVEGIRADGARPLEQRADSKAALRRLAQRYAARHQEEFSNEMEVVG